MRSELKQVAKLMKIVKKYIYKQISVTVTKKNRKWNEVKNFYLLLWNEVKIFYLFHQQIE